MPRFYPERIVFLPKIASFIIQSIVATIFKLIKPSHAKWFIYLSASVRSKCIKDSIISFMISLQKFANHQNFCKKIFAKQSLEASWKVVATTLNCLWRHFKPLLTSQ